MIQKIIIIIAMAASLILGGRPGRHNDQKGPIIQDGRLIYTPDGTQDERLIYTPDGTEEHAIIFVRKNDSLYVEDKGKLRIASEEERELYTKIRNEINEIEKEIKEIKEKNGWPEGTNSYYYYSSKREGNE